MAARLARFDNDAQGSEPDRRREPRYDAGVKATMESSKGDRVDVSLAEISLHGCSVTGDATWLRTGSVVSIAITDAAPLQAIVRWVRGDAAGMEFLWPITSDRTDWHALIDGLL